MKPPRMNVTPLRTSRRLGCVQDECDFLGYIRLVYARRPAERSRSAMRAAQA